MATNPDITSMALFCDFENVALGVRDTQHEKFDIKLVLERLLLKGSIVVKKAYCDWERYKGFKSTMHEANFELIEIPHVRQSGKNSADIRLVVDALDLCYTKAHVNTFVIISGDSDFSPLVSKLRENNKQVIGVGVKQSTSDLLTANCDEFIFYDDLVRESGRQSSRREARPAPPANRRPSAPAANPEEARRRDEAEARKAKGLDLALQTFEALYSERSDGGKIWASVLKEAIKRRKPDFSESYYGFRSFGGLLEEMQARGFLEMGRDEKSNAFVFRSSSTGQAAASHDPGGSPASLSAPAAPEVLPVVHRAGETEAREPRERGRGRGPRSRGGRAAPDRHDFEPTLTVDAQPVQPAEPVAADPDDFDDGDDAAERFADAARESQASRNATPHVLDAREPTPDGDTDASDPDAGDAPAPRESTGRRGNRGGRGGRGERNERSGGGDKPPRAPQGEREPRAVEAAPTPMPAPTPAAPIDAPAPAADVAAERPPAAKTPRPRTAGRKTAVAQASEAAPETAPGTPAKPARKSPAKPSGTTSDQPAPRARRPRKAADEA